MDETKQKTLKNLQKDVKDCAESFNFDWSNYVQYIHLVEDVAELGEALTVDQGDRKAGSGEQALADHTDPKEELGDILFTTLQLANQLNVNMEEVMRETFERYDGKLKKLKESST